MRILQVAILLALCAGLVYAREARAEEAAQVIKTTPQVNYASGWQRWPPGRYDREWPRIEPDVREIRDGARFDWLAASYEVRIYDGWLELWQGFGGQSGLILRTFADTREDVLLLTHPWRGPQLLFFEDGHILKAIYPVNYYSFQEARLAGNVDPDSWWQVVIARNGPVIGFMRGSQRVLAWYTGKGYSLLLHDQHVSHKDAAALAVNNAGDAVIAWTELGRLTVQKMSEQFGWSSEQIRGYRSGNAWRLEHDEELGLVLRYQSSRDWETKELDAQVIGLWW